MLREAAAGTDQDLHERVGSGGDRSGCTAVFGLVSESHIVVANIGDSRAILLTRHKGELVTVPMSHDHKPTNVSA